MKFSTLIAKRPPLCCGALLLLSGLLAGCNRDQGQVYQVAKDPAKPQEAQAATMPPGHPDISNAGAMPNPAAAALPSLQWKLPAGWEEAPAGQMRVASFKVKNSAGKTADVGVFPLPGMAGGDVNNVNRWRGQVGLSPLPDAEVAKQAEAIKVGDQAAQLYDMAGESPGSGDKTRILAAILHQNDVAWFFKMTGNDELVAQQKPAFVEFLKSLTFGPPAQAELPPSHPPISGAAMAAAAGAPAASESKPSWEVPGSWKEVPGGQFLVAKFVVTGADKSEAAVNVSMSVGDGGGLAGNINRWRGQLGLSQVPEGELGKLVTSMDLPGGKATLVDLSGVDARTGQKARLVGAVVPQSGRTWFYKLMGNEQVVDKEKDAFVKFVQTARYPNAS